MPFVPITEQAPEYKSPVTSPSPYSRFTRNYSALWFETGISGGRNATYDIGTITKRGTLKWFCLSACFNGTVMYPIRVSLRIRRGGSGGSLMWTHRMTHGYIGGGTSVADSQANLNDSGALDIPVEAGDYIEIAYFFNTSGCDYEIYASVSVLEVQENG